MSMFQGELAGAGAKADVPRYTVDGKRSLISNPTDLDVVDIIEGGCEGCPLAATHNVTTHCALQVPHGEGVRERVPDENKLTADDLNILQAALHSMSTWAHGPIPDNVPYNAADGGATDGGDNASQFVVYEVLSASDHTLYLKGPHPGHIEFSKAVLNPNYDTGEVAPLEMRPPGLTDAEWDDSAGRTPEDLPPFFPGAGWARFINQPVIMCLPPGAVVEFVSADTTGHPDQKSVLANKMRPMVKVVHPPETYDLTDVTFSIEVDQSVSRAREPYDLGDVPSTYYIVIRWEALHPADWRHFVNYPMTWFTRKTTALATGALHELLDSDGASTRVLFPGMVTGWDTGFICQLVTGRIVDVRNERSPVTDLPRLRTIEDGAGWITTLDLRGLEAEGAGCFVAYCPEATEDDTFRLPMQSTCSNAFPDESYATDDGWRCGAPAASRYTAFKKICWKPSTCDGFAVGDKVAFWRADLSGPDLFLPHRWGDAAWWNKVWSGVGWVFQQTMATPTFDGVLYQRGGGFSVESLFGRFIDQAPIIGGVMSKELWFRNVWGERFAWTDTSGNEKQAVLGGAFCRQGIDESATGGPDLAFDPTVDRDHPGTASAVVVGWTTRNDAVGAAPSEVAEYPDRTGGAIVGQLTEAPGAWTLANELCDDMDGAIVNCNAWEVNGPLNSYILARFPE